MRDPARLSPGWRLDQQIFKLVEREPAIIQLYRQTRGNDVAAFCDVRQGRNLFVVSRQIVELPIRLTDVMIVHPLAFLACAPDTE